MALYAADVHDGRSSRVLFEISRKPPESPSAALEAVATDVHAGEGAVQGETHTKFVDAPSITVFDETNRCVFVTSPTKFGSTRA